MSRVPLPPIIEDVVSSLSVQVPSAPVVQANESLPMLVLISKNLSTEDLNEISTFGQVLVWKEAWKNIPFAQLQTFDYLIVDMRMADARTQLAKEDMSKYNVVHYTTWIQRVEDYIQQIPGAFCTDIPDSASSKADFDQKLLNEPLAEPSIIKSIIRFFVCALSK
jgi:hypothetical protein